MTGAHTDARGSMDPRSSLACTLSLPLRTPDANGLTTAFVRTKRTERGDFPFGSPAAAQPAAPVAGKLKPPRRGSRRHNRDRLLVEMTPSCRESKADPVASARFPSELGQADNF